MTCQLRTHFLSQNQVCCCFQEVVIFFLVSMFILFLFFINLSFFMIFFKYLYFYSSFDQDSSLNYYSNYFHQNNLHYLALIFNFNNNSFAIVYSSLLVFLFNLSTMLHSLNQINELIHFFDEKHFCCCFLMFMRIRLLFMLEIKFSRVLFRVFSYNFQKFIILIYSFFCYFIKQGFGLLFMVLPSKFLKFLILMC
jgi:hypothetical protein